MINVCFNRSAASSSLFLSAGVGANPETKAGQVKSKVGRDGQAAADGKVNNTMRAGGGQHKVGDGHANHELSSTTRPAPAACRHDMAGWHS